MREYIQKIVLAMRFLERIIQKNDAAFSVVLNQQALELLKLSEHLNIKDIKNKIQYIVELIDMANMESLLTSMNAEIFINSCVTFIKHLDASLMEVDLENSTLKNLEEYSEIFDRKKAKENVQNIFLENQEPKNIKNIVAQKMEIEDFETKEGVDEVDEKIAKKIASRTGVLNQRQKKILDVLAIGGLGLKELTEQLPDLNEKAIQRDLLNLIRNRKIIMIGKKRWSKYYLK